MATIYPNGMVRLFTAGLCVSLAIALLLARPTHGDRLSPQQALEQMAVAQGLQVKTFASDPDIVSISNIDVDHRGRVWACECVNYRGNRGKRPQGDRILILEDTSGDGVSDKTTVFYQGRDVDIAMGLCVLGNKAIVSVAPNILLLEDTDGDDKADKKTVLFTSDAVFQHDHSLHSFVFGPDGRFYANFGNTGHQLKNAQGQPIVDRRGRSVAGNGKPYHGGIVFRCDRQFGNVDVLGHNFRNNYEATVDSFGGVWQSDNDDDGNLAVRLNYILEGGNYGYLDELTGERWRTPRIGAHPFRGKRHWHQNDPGSVPNVIETGNGAPTGVTVYEGDLLPTIFRDQVIFCDAGPHVVWALPVDVKGAGFTARKADIIRSSDKNFRPVDAAVAPDGSLLVSDWYDPVIGGFKQDDIQRGRIYWIAPKGHKYASPRYNFDSPKGAAQALLSPNYCARYLAWLRLHQLGAKAEKSLASLLAHPNPRMRARALWLLGQIPGRETQYIERASQDEHAEVRVVGIRLAQLLNRDVLRWIDKLSGDTSARVRAECAVQLRHYNSAAAARAWAKLAAKHDRADRWYVEALGIGADGKWDACLAAYAKLNASQPAKARNDIVWRSRATQTPQDLARIVLSADKGEDVRRYIRAFDFQSAEPKYDALLSIAVGRQVPNEIALAALDRVPIATLRADNARRQRLETLLAANRLNRASLRLIVQLEVKSLYPSLLQAAQREEGDLRIDAMSALLDLEQHALVNAALLDKDPKTVLATGRALAQSQHSTAMTLLLPFMEDAKLDANARKETARTLSKSRFGAGQLITLLENKQLASNNIRQAIAGPLLTHTDRKTREQAEQLFQLTPSKGAQPLPTLPKLIAMQGSAESGRQVYLKLGKCATCHRVHDQGKAVGPDLSQIGTKLARAVLFESILYPSAAIGHNYESYSARLKNGRTVTGVLANKNARQIQLRDAEGILRTVDRSMVEEFRRESVSLMPANLHESMTTQELVDLVSYLATLKAKKVP